MSKSTDMTPRPELEQQGQIFLNAADALKDQVDNAQVLEGGLSAIKEKYYSQLKSVNPVLAEEFMNAKTIRDIRALAAPFVNLNRAVKMTKDSSSSVFNKFITGSKTGLESVDITKPGTWVNPVLQRADVKSKIARKIGGEGAKKTTGKTAPSLLKKIVGAGASAAKSPVAPVSTEVINE